VRDVFALAESTIPQSDAVLLTLAPILGDVLTIRKPLARYRVHPASYGGMESLEAVKFRTRLQQDVDRAHLLTTVCQRLGLSVQGDHLRRSLNHLQYRLASYLTEPSAHPFLRMHSRDSFAASWRQQSDPRRCRYGTVLSCSFGPSRARRRRKIIAGI